MWDLLKNVFRLQRKIVVKLPAIYRAHRIMRQSEKLIERRLAERKKEKPEP